MFLEDLLGTTAGAHDIPDALGWELKWHSDRTSLVTLFHKEPDGPEAIMRYMVRRYGRRDGQGRLSPAYNPGTLRPLQSRYGHRTSDCAAAEGQRAGSLLVARGADRRGGSEVAASDAGEGTAE